MSSPRWDPVADGGMPPWRKARVRLCLLTLISSAVPTGLWLWNVDTYSFWLGVAGGVAVPLMWWLALRVVVTVFTPEFLLRGWMRLEGLDPDDPVDWRYWHNVDRRWAGRQDR